MIGSLHVKIILKKNGKKHFQQSNWTLLCDIFIIDFRGSAMHLSRILSYSDILINENDIDYFICTTSRFFSF